ncbi:hypothetical protein [Micromonospora sp. NPDC023888]|uniref:hypothetical protein n=1 Tax=Micromonospora sp. NPDC023888 TaxID=3155607 RepID=UPI0033D73033
MRVQIIYNFYFDYALPRLDVSEPIRLHIHINGKYEADAFIMGWDSTNDLDPLFHAENGLTLASAELNLRPIDRPGLLAHRVSDHVLDRLMVIMEWDAEIGPTQDGTDPQVWLQRSASLADNLLDHLRVVSASPRVKRIPRYWKLGHSEFVIACPHTESWFNKDDGSPLPMFDGMNSFNSTGSIVNPESGTIAMADLQRSLTAEQDPPLHASLLIDAQEALTTLSIRQAVLSIGSACEVRATTYGENQRRIRQSKVKAAIAPRNGLSFADRYFHHLPHETCGRSLKHENRDAFEKIQAAYNERNKLIHTGKLSAQLAAEQELDQYRAVSLWIAAAEAACRWIGDLPTEVDATA